MDVTRFVNEIMVLGLGEELANSLVGHFNVRFRPQSEVPSLIHNVKLEEILIEVFKRVKIKRGRSWT